MFNKYLAGAILLLGLALYGMTQLWLGARDDLAGLKVQYTAQQKETEKANQHIKDLNALHDLQRTRYADLEKERGKDAIRLQEEIRRINKVRETSEKAALKHPERFGNIATYNLRRGMRDVCRSGGGTPETCKIEIPKSSAPGSSASLQSDVENVDRVGEADQGGGRTPGSVGVSDPQR